jgi:predicted transcriptional regulator
LLKIAEIIEPEKISHDDILNAIQEGLDDVKNGRITEHMAVMNEAKERIAKKKNEYFGQMSQIGFRNSRRFSY